MSDRLVIIDIENEGLRENFFIEFIIVRVVDDNWLRTAIG